MLHGKRILLIFGGGIAAFKSLDLIRRLRERGAYVTPVLTRGATEFVTQLSVSSLAGEKTYTDLFDLTDEADMGHIQLSRVADLIVVAPATADLMAKMAHGLAGDLASTLLLATDTPVLCAPAMNVRMWEHAATQRNLATLTADGIRFCGPNSGDMACGEFGPGRMSEPLEIVAAIEDVLADGPLKGRRVVVTSGPTHEPIDPVRYIANRSSGAQGTAIANALSALGADVVFVTGPADAPRPPGTQIIEVQTAREMLSAVQDAGAVDAAICAAAVADWHVIGAGDRKLKKSQDGTPALDFGENPDILKTISQPGDTRPALVIGFAAETNDVIENATAKRLRKGCDWIVANDVRPETGVMGGRENDVTLITETGVENWPRMAKTEVAKKLAQAVAEALSS
ncbi:MAG: bifunctional phosphopantothenoylcysteine decarboxylase/phosphopantothenate--cysteine ligase CoaBC [Aliishimia sp.]